MGSRRVPTGCGPGAVTARAYKEVRSRPAGRLHAARLCANSIKSTSVVYLSAIGRGGAAGVFPRGVGQVLKLRAQIKQYVAGQLAACTQPDPAHPDRPFRVGFDPPAVQDCVHLKKSSAPVQDSAAVQDNVQSWM